jgi:hypothetical protein
MKAPDPNWMPFAQLAVFAWTVTLLGILAMTFGIGHIDPNYSMGLKEALSDIGVLAGAMGGWFARGAMEDGKAK